MRARGPVVAGLLAAVVALSFGAGAGAQQAQCEVLSIRASTEGADVGAALEAYRAQLMRPPLNAFTSFVLMGSQTLRLEPGAAQTLTLGDGITGELRVLEAARPGRQRLRLILRRGEQTLVNSQVALTAGHPFFVAGPMIPGGTLVLGVICR